MRNGLLYLPKPLGSPSDPSAPGGDGESYSVVTKVASLGKSGKSPTAERSRASEQAERRAGPTKRLNTTPPPRAATREGGHTEGNVRWKPTTMPPERAAAAAASP